MLAETVVNQALAFLGYNMADGSHKKIIDIYNSISPLPVGYKVRYTDQWCAAFVSAVGQSCNATDIILPECSAGRMMNLYKEKGRFYYNGRPAAGDVLFYDWDKNGNPDHVGIIESVHGDDLIVIEGNYHKRVAERYIRTDNKDVLGFAHPAYDPADTGIWIQIDSRWKYKLNGSFVHDKWVKDSIDWCYIGSTCNMLTNAWIRDSEGWCFVKDDGHLLRDGYASDCYGEHYIDSTGHMK